MIDRLTATANRIQDGLTQIAIDQTKGKTPKSVFVKRIKEMLDLFGRVYHCGPRDPEICAYASPLIQRVANRLEKAREWAKLPSPFQQEDFSVCELPELPEELASDFQVHDGIVELRNRIALRTTHYEDIRDRLSDCIQQFARTHRLKSEPMKESDGYPKWEGQRVFRVNTPSHLFADQIAAQLSHLTRWFAKVTPGQFRKRSASFS